MKNYILIKDEKSIQFDNINDLIKYLLGDDYYTLPEEQRFIKRYENAFNNIMALNKNINIVHTLLGVIIDNYKVIQTEYSISTDFIIDTDITYILSLCRLNKFLLLEKIGINNIILPTTEIKLEKTEDNFIVINEYVNRLMVHHILQKIN